MNAKHTSKLKLWRGCIVEETTLAACISKHQKRMHALGRETPNFIFPSILEKKG